MPLVATQLSIGCGSPRCQNAYCRSSRCAAFPLGSAERSSSTDRLAKATEAVDAHMYGALCVPSVRRILEMYVKGASVHRATGSYRKAAYHFVWCANTTLSVHELHARTEELCKDIARDAIDINLIFDLALLGKIVYETLYASNNMRLLADFVLDRCVDIAESSLLLQTFSSLIIASYASTSPDQAATLMSKLAQTFGNIATVASVSSAALDTEDHAAAIAALCLIPIQFINLNRLFFLNLCRLVGRSTPQFRDMFTLILRSHLNICTPSEATNILKTLVGVCNVVLISKLETLMQGRSESYTQRGVDFDDMDAHVNQFEGDGEEQQAIMRQMARSSRPSEPLTLADIIPEVDFFEYILEFMRTLHQVNNMVANSSILLSCERRVARSKPDFLRSSLWVSDRLQAANAMVRQLASVLLVPNTIFCNSFLNSLQYSWQLDADIFVYCFDVSSLCCENAATVPLAGLPQSLIAAAKSILEMGQSNDEPRSSPGYYIPVNRFLFESLKTISIDYTTQSSAIDISDADSKLNYILNLGQKELRLTTAPTSLRDDLKDPINFYLRKSALQNRASSASRRNFSFSNYPFILSDNTKQNIIRYEIVRMNQSCGIRPSNAWVIHVTRDTLITDFYASVLGLSNGNGEFNWTVESLRPQFRRQIHIIFDGEIGFDQGGLRAEFFDIVLSTLVESSPQLFVHLGNSVKLYPNVSLFRALKERCDELADPARKHLGEKKAQRRDTYGHHNADYTDASAYTAEQISEYFFECRRVYTLLGMLLGAAVANRCIMPNLFPSAFYKLVLGFAPTHGDLEGVDSEIHQSLVNLMTHTDDALWDPETLCVTFDTVLPGGSDVFVTAENIELFAALKVRQLLYSEEIFGYIRAGLLLVLKARSLTLLDPLNLERLICGEPFLDFEDLRDGASYDAPYTERAKVITWFWEIVLGELTIEQQKSLLKFITSTASAPLGGLRNVHLKIIPSGEDDCAFPTSHTCLNILCLPQYTSKSVLKTRLLTAIEYNEGFGAA